MASVDLFYHYPRCGTCERARSHLASRGIAIEREVDAKATPMGAEACLEIARRLDRIVSIKGGRVAELGLRPRPSDGQILDLMLGPQRTLRVPSILAGRTLYVGFSVEGLRDL